jgi:predicted aconitase
MHLTREEERVFNGECGWANQICMKILVRLGELFNAARLIPINSAHTSGVSYKTLGDAPTEFLQELADAKVRATVKATLNPQSFDGGYLRDRFPLDLRQKQSKVIECFKRMGFIKSLTCTPYYLEKPRKGAHVAWAESSAVVYANSVINAWTNREGGPSALAAAIIGKTPEYGMHKTENRQPKALIKLETQLKSEIEFGALGILLGKALENNIPSIRNLQNASKDNLKQLGAALASTGMVNMFYHDGKKAEKGIENISVEASDIKRTIEDLSTTSTAKSDLVFLGCPHCSMAEIKRIACSICSRKMREGTELWVCTSRFIKEKAAKHVAQIEGAGGHVITDTCAVVTWTEKLGIKTIMTNSAKTAHYAPTMNKAESILAPLEDCLERALQG